ncbi:MAG: ribonuclease HI [Geminocystis sp.]|nr:ribonuclease HI [Geminocystis sp.]HIK37757.1 ribonuclease HI [Geminocystis sp. M7585_C2015_104]MCS7148933.1 ribonuclease HI [Geminocystis sp.]MCX8077444.1 ribonuclease HI [Geminocystis sp.]MDW8117334.1 ribonuclease HI [Geminocystis sp.]
MNENLPQVEIYTDGSCLNNPGKGGYAAILIYGSHRKEIYGGYRYTTNNRMEIMAVIQGLKALKRPCRVNLYTDSQYVVNAMTKGWVEKWQKNNWRRSAHEKAKNVDLWQELLRVSKPHHVNYIWVRGHAGHPENERCDYLAHQAAMGSNLAEDEGLEEDILG